MRTSCSHFLHSWGWHQSGNYYITPVKGKSASDIVWSSLLKKKKNYVPFQNCSSTCAGVDCTQLYVIGNAALSSLHPSSNIVVPCCLMTSALHESKSEHVILCGINIWTERCTTQTLRRVPWLHYVNPQLISAWHVFWATQVSGEGDLSFLLRFSVYDVAKSDVAERQLSHNTLAERALFCVVCICSAFPNCSKCCQSCFLNLPAFCAFSCIFLSCSLFAPFQPP